MSGTIIKNNNEFLAIWIFIAAGIIFGAGTSLAIVAVVIQE